jgi:hypothetical protein
MTIGMTDIGEVVFLPALLERLSRVAPGIALNTVRDTSVNLSNEMADGRVDLAIGLLPQLKGGFYQRRLFDQRYVCLFRRGHPLEEAPLTLAAWREAEHLVVVSAGTGHGQVDDWLKRRGVRRQVRLTVPHFMSVGYILQRTNLIATVPERLALQLATPFSLSLRGLPMSLPAAPIHLLWHARVQQDEGNRWLRSVVIDLFADTATDVRKGKFAQKKKCLRSTGSICCDHGRFWPMNGRRCLCTDGLGVDDRFCSPAYAFSASANLPAAVLVGAASTTGPIHLDFAIGRARLEKPTAST